MRYRYIELPRMEKNPAQLPPAGTRMVVDGDS
jgi:hypothetical protein